MKISLPQLTLFFGALILNSSCGLVKKKRPSPPEQINRHEHFPDLRKIINEITAADSLKDSCDQATDPLLPKILEAIEAHSADIEKFNNNSNKNANYDSYDSETAEVTKELSLGNGFSIKKYKLKRAIKNEWSKDAYYTYNDLWSYIQSGRMDGPEDWALAENIFRTILGDDYNRRVYFENTYTTREQWPIMRELQEKLDKCKDDSDCGIEKFKASLSPELSEHISKNPFAQYFLDEQKAQNFQKQRDENLYYFKLYVDANIRWKKSWVSPNIESSRNLGGITYTAHMHAEFENKQALKFLTDEIESFWMKNTQMGSLVGLTDKVKIKWAGLDSLPTPFRFIFNMELGRAHVKKSEKLMNIYLGDGVDVFLHEFGHVLGLPDRYWEYRNLSTCANETEAIESDIMSRNRPGGNWLPSDWEDLAKNYPLSSP